MTTGNGFPAECYSVFKIMWYRDNEPSMFARIHKVIGTKDYINLKLTGRILTEMDPNYVGALSVMIVPGTPLSEEEAQGRFVLPAPFELIEELRTMLTQTHMHGLFFSNHASNYLALKVRMPKDKGDALRIIDEVLAKRNPALLRPDYVRAL
jgi:hypothetical protein